MRNRSAASPVAAAQKSTTTTTPYYDSKHGNKKYPNMTIAMWAAISIAVIFLLGSAITGDGDDNDGYRSDPTLRPKSKKHHKKKKGFSLFSSSPKTFQHETGFGNGKKTTACPEAFKKKFWMETKKINQPVARALRMQGWSRTDNYEEAQVVWTIWC